MKIIIEKKKNRSGDENVATKILVTNLFAEMCQWKLLNR